MEQELCTLSLSPLTPYQFVVAGDSPYVRADCEYEFRFLIESYRHIYSTDDIHAAVKKQPGVEHLQMN